MKILLLDDNDELIQSLQLFFHLHGYDCMTVDNPVNALSYVNTFEPDVLISDFDGDENYVALFKLILQQKKKTKIIVLTSNVCQISEQKRLMDLGVSTVLKKPILPERILEIIHHFEKKFVFSFLKAG